MGAGAGERRGDGRGRLNSAAADSCVCLKQVITAPSVTSIHPATPLTVPPAATSPVRALEPLTAKEPPPSGPAPSPSVDRHTPLPAVSKPPILPTQLSPPSRPVSSHGSPKPPPAESRVEVEEEVETESELSDIPTDEPPSPPAHTADQEQEEMEIVVPAKKKAKKELSNVDVNRSGSVEKDREKEKDLARIQVPVEKSEVSVPPVDVNVQIEPQGEPPPILQPEQKLEPEPRRREVLAMEVDEEKVPAEKKGKKMLSMKEYSKRKALDTSTVSLVTPDVPANPVASQQPCASAAGLSFPPEPLLPRVAETALDAGTSMDVDILDKSAAAEVMPTPSTEQPRQRKELVVDSLLLSSGDVAAVMPSSFQPSKSQPDPLSSLFNLVPRPQPAQSDSSVGIDPMPLGSKPSGSEDGAGPSLTAPPDAGDRWIARDQSITQLSPSAPLLSTSGQILSSMEAPNRQSPLPPLLQTIPGQQITPGPTPTAAMPSVPAPTLSEKVEPAAPPTQEPPRKKMSFAAYRDRLKEKSNIEPGEIPPEPVKEPLRVAPSSIHLPSARMSPSRKMTAYDELTGTSLASGPLSPPSQKALLPSLLEPGSVSGSPHKIDTPLGSAPPTEPRRLIEDPNRNSPRSAISSRPSFNNPLSQKPGDSSFSRRSLPFASPNINAGSLPNSPSFNPPRSLSQDMENLPKGPRNYGSPNQGRFGRGAAPPSGPRGWDPDLPRAPRALREQVSPPPGTSRLPAGVPTGPREDRERDRDRDTDYRGRFDGVPRGPSGFHSGYRPPGWRGRGRGR
ncbi:hypothetical protein BT69DRAFT_1041560 [Atractiella rhizophila]|nr:hypothetical protein BT69DRAFT_1041560 [Atractiella rhizophila]